MLTTRTPHAHNDSEIAQAQRSYPWLIGTLAALLWLAAASPYAYLEPRLPGAPSNWASYLGPYPSSLAITGIALAARPQGEGDLDFTAAIQSGDLTRAEAILGTGVVSAEIMRLGPSLVAAHAGNPAVVIELLPASTIRAARDARGAVLRGDALRSLGDESGARMAFTPRFVDDANPVDWAWEWLRPVSTRRIDLGGNLDLGYISGCYLGEGDPVERTTYRWCSDGAQLRFPAAGASTSQQLVFMADGRGWPEDMLPVPPVQVLIGDVVIGTFTPDHIGPREFSVTMPPSSQGSDIIVTLRTATFITGPERYLRQQSEQVLGQVQRLGVRLDWVELRMAR